MEEDETLALLALHAAHGGRAGPIAGLRGAANSFLEALAAPTRCQEFLPRGWTERAPHELLALVRSEGGLQRRALDMAGARTIAATDPGYPPLLLQLADPPPLLAVQGETAVLAPPGPVLSVIGARACTPYGREQARRFGAIAGGAGVVVASGAARGIDQAAMEGALETGGRVIAVLGSGIDRPYPPEARGLLQRIVAAGGAVVSEFPCGTPPLRHHFPQRNRILAALARAVLVVQAGELSGSMSTVRAALELGREVLAVPGPVDCSVSRGPHKLLREGAGIAASAQDLLDALRSPWEGLAPQAESPVLAGLAAGDASPDALAARLGLPIEIILLELVECELRGRVTQVPGGLYHRCGPAEDP
ncbi:MAG TPA: DNA-processing protein DprA [Planctomycetota bacterium]